MKVKDMVRTAILSTNKVIVKQGSEIVIETDFGSFPKDEELLNKKINGFRIIENKMHLFIS